MEKNMKHYNIEQDMRYLQLLSQSFPTIAEASTEIINLQAILNLPKGTEHFLADIHGEYEAFLHVLKNASGNIKRKVNELFGNTLREQEKRELCSLIYYPEQKLELVKQNEPDINDWYHITLHQLVAVCRDVSSKYTRSKVRKSLPCDFSYIIQELLHEHTEDHDKTAYVNVIVDTIISTGRADDFIIAIANVIQRLAIDQLHILGDIYDRGPGAHIILDKMRRYHSWDIQWGNHDVLWMGAAAGNDACICNVPHRRNQSLIKLRGYGLRAGNYTIGNYIAVFTEDKQGINALLVSIFLAVSSATITAVLGTVIVTAIRNARKSIGNIIEGISLLPEMLPSIVLVLGIMLFYNGIYRIIPIYGTIWIMVLSYVILFLPYTIQYVTSAYSQISGSLIAAGRICGAGPLYIFMHITLPLIARGIASGWMMTFIIAFRELVTPSLIAPTNTLTVSTYINRQFEQGSVGKGMAMAVICILFSTVSLLLLNTVINRKKT